jgi:hypothetical protein
MSASSGIGPILVYHRTDGIVRHFKNSSKEKRDLVRVFLPLVSTYVTWDSCKLATRPLPFFSALNAWMEKKSDKTIVEFTDMFLMFTSRVLEG